MKTSLLITISLVAVSLLAAPAYSADSASASYQGTTTAMTKNPDGTYTVTKTDAEGHTTVKVIGKPKAENRPIRPVVPDGHGGWKPYVPGQ